MVDLPVGTVVLLDEPPVEVPVVDLPAGTVVLLDGPSVVDLPAGTVSTTTGGVEDEST